VRNTRGFTLIEILVGLAIMVILAAFLLPQLTKSVSTAKLTTAREQAMQIQQALDSWLAGSSVSTAHATFGTGDYPNDTTAMLTVLKPYLSADTQALFRVSTTDSTHILSDVMEDNGWYLRLNWPAATWTTDHPRVEFVTP
jgi:prepilin-type N-terminal cleavage/methylation domain-containing protein